MKIRYLWQKRKSIIFTWLISYSAVLFIPMIVSLVVYWQSAQALRSEIHRANDFLLKQVRYTIDNQIDLMKRLNMEVTWNAKLQTLMYSSSPQADAQFTAYQLVREFRMYQTSYATIDEFYVIWAQENSVLRPGNVRDMKTAFNTIHNTGMMSYDQWKDKLKLTSNNQFLLLPHVDSSGPQTSIAYITHLPKDLNGNETGSVVVMADTERFQEAIESISGFSGGQVLVLNQDNQVLLSNLPLSAHEDRILERLVDGQESTTPTRDGDLELVYVKSAISDLKYALIIPSNIYWEKAEYVRRFTYISLLFSLMGAGVLTWFFLRRNYSPIQELVQSLTDKGEYEEQKDWNELSFIQRAFLNTWNEREKMAVQMQSHQNVLRSNMLNRLLKGRMDSPVPYYEEAFKSFNMKLRSDDFAVILFVVENDDILSSKLPGNDLNERRKLLQFIITNVVEELVGQRGHAGYMAEADDMMVCLVNLDAKEPEELKRDLHAIAEEAQLFLMRFEMDLTVAIGGIHTTLAGIAAAYQEAVDAMEYRMVIGKQEIIAYDDIRPDKTDRSPYGYYYPLQTEQQMINFIKIGDYEQASAYMNEMMELNFNKPLVSVTLARCLIFDLAGTMVKAMNELDVGDSSILGDNPLWMDKIMACDTVQEMRLELLTLLREVCAFASARKDSHLSRERMEALRELIAKVTRYIEAHFNDSNLNVNTIGEAFELKGSYLSKLFKDQTGEGLLDYIHKYRIAQAKDMIRSKQESVTDVARLVGYNEAATFIRVFKKYEGITPGKFKEMN